jgi:hypothetical protein
MNNKLELRGIGIYIEIYQRDNRLTKLEILKEAYKTIKREVLRHEPTTSSGISGESNNNGL